MRLDEIGLLVGLSFLLCFAELFDQAHRLALETAVEPTTRTGVDDITELFGGEVEESVVGVIVRCILGEVAGKLATTDVKEG